MEEHDFERQLKDALRREEAPPWFEAKVLAAAARQQERRRSWFDRLFAAGRLGWASAALAGVLMTGVVWQRERAAEQERERGEAAKAQLELALKITSEKLNKIQKKVETINEGF